MAHLHPIIFISSESSFQALQSNRTNFQYIYNFNHFIDFQRSMETKKFGEIVINVNGGFMFFVFSVVFGKNHAKFFFVCQKCIG